MHCNRDLEIMVVVTDAAGRKFDNIASLEFEWDNSDTRLGSLAVNAGVMVDQASKRSRKHHIGIQILMMFLNYLEKVNI